MIHELENEALKIEVDGATTLDGVKLFWRGKSNSRHPGKVLDPYLSSLAEAAAGHGMKIEMHFEKLEYLNSSTVSSIIRFIRCAKEKDIELTIVYDESCNWQRLSFDALRIFADGRKLTLSGAPAAAA